MKKQFLCLLLALMLTVGLLPIAAAAETDKPDAKFDFILGGVDLPEDADAALVMKAGDEAKYYATKQTDPAYPDNWYLTPGTETEWNVKFEYPADGIPTVTLKDAKIVNKFGLWFGGINIPMTGDVKVIVEGTNQIEYVSGADTELPLYGALMLRTTGTATIAGPGKLNITSDHHYTKSDKSVVSGVLAADGNLILDNVDIFISMPETKGKTNGVYSGGGDVTVKGGSLTIVAYDNPKTLHDPDEESGYRRNQEAILSALFVKKTEAGTGGNFTVQDGATVQIMASPTKNAQNKGNLIYTEGTFTIKDSTVELGLVGKISSGVLFFSQKPTLEFANNTYTIAATESAYPQYTHGVVALTPDENLLVDFLGDDVLLPGLTYFKVTSGGPGGPHCQLPPVKEPEEPAPTEPKPTESTPAPSQPEETQPAPTTEATEPSETTPATQPPEQDTPVDKDSGNGLLVVVIVICSVLVAASGFALYWFVFRTKKN